VLAPIISDDAFSDFKLLILIFPSPLKIKGAQKYVRVIG
jgi:hypothetical protein